MGIIADDSKFKIEKFNGTNFTFWKMQVDDLLCQTKLYLLLDVIAKKSESMSIKEWKILDQMTLGLIQFSLFSSVAFNIMKEKTTVDLMAALTRM